jgi:hypothetical protein
MVASGARSSDGSGPFRGRGGRRKPSLPLLILCAAPWLAACATLRAPAPPPDVCERGCAFASIQAAIDAAPPGAAIVVGPGRYRERLDFRGKDLTVRSADPEDPLVVAATVVDGGGAGSTVSFTSGEGRAAVLEGVTVTNGGGTLLQGRTWGGGILVARSSPTVRACVVRGNAAAMGGGIAVLKGGAAPLVERCRLEENTADTDGGGFFAAGGEFRECRVVRNVSKYSGGGGFCLGAVVLESCTFTGNTAVSNGGGLFLEGQGPEVRPAACVVSGNRAGSLGGGLAVKECSPQVVNFLLEGNKAHGGGGVAVFGSRAAPRIVNATVTANEAAQGGALFSGGARPTVVNSILWGNRSRRGPGEVGLEGEGGLTAEYSDIRGGWPGAGVVDLDPAFSGQGRWPYALAAGSPCIDAGTEAGAPLLDLRGTPRPQPGRSGAPARTDLGAFEFAPGDRPGG